MTWRIKVNIMGYTVALLLNDSWDLDQYPMTLKVSGMDALRC